MLGQISPWIVGVPQPPSQLHPPVCPHGFRFGYHGVYHIPLLLVTIQRGRGLRGLQRTLAE